MPKNVNDIITEVGSGVSDLVVRVLDFREGMFGVSSFAGSSASRSRNGYTPVTLQVVLHTFLAVLLDARFL